MWIRLNTNLRSKFEENCHNSLLFVPLLRLKRILIFRSYNLSEQYHAERQDSLTFLLMFYTYSLHVTLVELRLLYINPNANNPELEGHWHRRKNPKWVATSIPGYSVTESDKSFFPVTNCYQGRKRKNIIFQEFVKALKIKSYFPRKVCSNWSIRFNCSVRLSHIETLIHLIILVCLRAITFILDAEYLSSEKENFD